ncbi:LysR family transcriptional regulator [Leucothrix arctica]|uniref:LysR family transcriptional regulator n=1 Tax=Leucothrix arctica TaxID=1481894 RepID=A0A317CBD8_9GAMM|nr:LysR family transcriptional regulator [Leucothrix arctica]PWQ95954.1 LysR family transcriptional regulator [Leucothrix arctica]
MTLEQILTFLQVARLGGVRRAAQQMHISQPAISARISSLESDLAVKLFTRGPKGVSLTKQGIIFRGHAEKIAVALEDIKTEVVPAESKSSLLRIGVAETVAQTWLPAFLQQLSLKYPKINIEISVDLSVNLREGLLERAYDLVVLMGPVSEYSVDNILMPTFKLAWYKPIDMISPDLSNIPVISYHRTSRPYRVLNQELHARYGSKAKIFPTNSLSAGFDMIATGIGVGLMPEILGERLVKEGRIANFDAGWLLTDLDFTASYIADSKGTLPEQAAKIAQQAANLFFETDEGFL